MRSLFRLSRLEWSSTLPPDPEEPPSVTLQLGSAGGDPFEELEREPRGEGRSWNWSSNGAAGEGHVQIFTFP